MTSGLLLDFRLALRRLRTRPGLSAVLVATLAVAVGAVTAVVGVAWAVLGDPLPFPEPDRLAFVWARGVDDEAPAPGDEDPEVWLSPPEVEDLRRADELFDGVVALRDLTFRLSGDGPPEEVAAVAASPELFSVLGVLPARGRALNVADDRLGAPPVAVVSDGFWRRRLGGDPAAVGRMLRLDDTPYEVVGVLPPSFRLLPPSSVFPADATVWVPYEPHLPAFARDNRSVRFIHALARRAPGVSADGAAAGLATLSDRLRATHPEIYGDHWRLSVHDARDQVVGEARPALGLLVAAAGLLWLLACVNVAGLELGATAARRRELAVRAALGAGPGRTFRALFVESLVVTVLGGACGVVVAEGTRKAMGTLGGASIPRLARLEETGWEPLWIAVAAAVTLLTLLLCGLPAALGGIRQRLAPVLRGSGRGTTGGRAGWVRGGLVVAQVSLALLVLVGAGLLGRSFERVLAVPAGYQGEGVLTLRLSLPRDGYPDGARRAAFFDRVTTELAALPGVTSVGGVTQLPLSGAQLGSAFKVPGAGDTEALADLRGVTPGYFRTLSIPLLAGRPFTTADHADAPAVAVVDETFAREHWPGEDPIGRRIVWQRSGGELEVVGVTAPVHHDGPEAPPRATVYRPLPQYPRDTLFAVARLAGDGDPADLDELAALAKARVWELDPNLPVTVERFAAFESRALAERRFGVWLMGALSALALLLSMLGLYGLLSQWVTRRTAEIGVRFALGASPWAVLGLILRQGLALTALGLGLGLALALSGTRVLGSSLDPVVFGISPTDPWTLAAVSLLLFLSALAFSFLPARRAARLDPAALLREG